MNRILCTVIFCLFGSGILANPIPLPWIEISELYFDESDNWKLELAYYDVNPYDPIIDSILLCSGSDTVKLPAYDFFDFTGVLVITNDSLAEDFTINRYGDTIKIITFMWAEAFEDELIFGNCVNASINYPREGQSLSRYAIYFVKDNSPTIGSPNDTTGTCGTLRGVVFDKYNEPVENRKFLLDNYFKTSAEGEFTTRIYAKPLHFNKIYYLTAQNSLRSVPVSEVSFVMEPDSTINTDIYLLDTLLAGVTEYNFDMDPVRIFPVPVQANNQLHVDIDLPVISSDVRLEIVDTGGRLIREEKIFSQENVVDTPEKEGIYILVVRLENRIISSKKILVKK